MKPKDLRLLSIRATKTLQVAASKNKPDISSYVTGFVPAQIAQLGYLDARLRLFEFASVLVIVAVDRKSVV